MQTLITIVFIVTTALTCWPCATSAINILAIFPAPSYSHTVAARVLTQALAERGHSVTLLTTDARPMSHENITQIDLSFSYQLWKDGFDFVSSKENGVEIAQWIEGISNTIYDVLVKQLSSPGVQDLIKRRHELKFDLVIIEAMGFLPYHCFAELFEAPLIGFNSFDAPMDVHLTLGNYVNPFVIPDHALFPYIERLAIAERWHVLKTFAQIVWMMRIKSDFLDRYNYLISEFFPMVDSGPVELLNRIEFLLVNTHPALGFIRPLAPNTVQLGFLHIQPSEKLPTDLQRFLDRSENGVIYMSFGSNVKASTLNPKFVNIFLRVFESLPYDIIWKWETNEMENKPDNLLISQWLPVRFFFINLHASPFSLSTFHPFSNT